MQSLDQLQVRLVGLGAANQHAARRDRGRSYSGSSFRPATPFARGGGGRRCAQGMRFRRRHVHVFTHLQCPPEHPPRPGSIVAAVVAVYFVIVDTRHSTGSR